MEPKLADFGLSRMMDAEVKRRQSIFDADTNATDLAQVVMDDQKQSKYMTARTGTGVCYMLVPFRSGSQGEALIEYRRLNIVEVWNRAIGALGGAGTHCD